MERRPFKFAKFAQPFSPFNFSATLLRFTLFLLAAAFRQCMVLT
jgi:hypothetical protein